MCFPDLVADPPDSYTRPKWRKPTPLGMGGATDAVGGVASPLLAGFSLSALLAVSADRDHFRWPGLTTLLFTVTAMLLITAVQCSFRARTHLWSPAEVAAWWPDMNPARDEQLQYEQSVNFERWLRWAAWQGRMYNAGIAAMFAATSTALVPTSDASQPEFRWCAVAVAAAAGVGELAWHLSSRRTRP